MHKFLFLKALYNFYITNVDKFDYLGETLIHVLGGQVIHGTLVGNHVAKM